MWSPTIQALQIDSLKTLDCIEQLFGRLHQAPQHGQILPLDLSYIDFVKPTGVVTLALAIRFLAAQGISTQLTNVRSDVASYLERVNLQNVADGHLVLPPLKKIYMRRLASTSVVEIHQIPADVPLHKQAREQAQIRLLNVLRTWYQEYEATSLATIICELLKNITHSRDVGFIAAQKYRNPQLGLNEVCIAVGDLGLGIHKTLAQAGRIDVQTPHSTAIERALELNMSAGAGGVGLAVVEKYIQQWKGILSVRSATGRVTIENGQRSKEDNLLFVPGVQIGIVVRA